MIAPIFALLMVLWFALKRPLGMLALIFLFANFVWKLIAAIYLDQVGPIYSYEVDLMVGGGAAAEYFGIAIILSIAVFGYFFRLEYFNKKLTPNDCDESSFKRIHHTSDLVFAVACLYFVALVLDLLARGVIPLLDCMERYEYLAEYAGPLHLALFKYGPLIALQMGTFYVLPRLRGRGYDYRFLGLLVVMLLYSAATGSRFSAFYSFTLFFIMPFSALAALKLHTETLMLGKSSIEKSSGLVRRGYAVEVIFGAVLIAFFAIVHSYANVRSEDGCRNNARSASAVVPVGSSDASRMHADSALKRGETLKKMLDIDGAYARFLDSDSLFRLEQRVLVQPIHLWFLTWDRVFVDKDWDPTKAFNFVFNSELAREGNRSIRYLMALILPPERAEYLKSVGNQFAGGYPEILFELLGPWYAWLAVIFFGAVTAILVRHWMISLVRGNLVTAFFAAYVFYAFFVMYVGGMLNFLIVATFWTKVALLLFFSWYEPYRRALDRPLLPWVNVRGKSHYG
jgi:hypothetical protein